MVTCQEKILIFVKPLKILPLKSHAHLQPRSQHRHKEENLVAERFVSYRIFCPRITLISVLVGLTDRFRMDCIFERFWVGAYPPWLLLC